jgi:cytoskeleton protein RodZ
MSDPSSNLRDDDAAPAPYQPPSAGAELRAAREAAGLTIDAVAQQLKLAPRQVQALEDDDFARLPGRTFVRGFVRNYARYLGLDPDDVVSLLPGADVAPSLQRPTITPSGRPMGQLPADAVPRRTWTRWAIPLALVAIAGAAGVYELRRPQGDLHKSPTPTEPALRAPIASAPVTSGGTTSATLPNPLTDGASASSAPATSGPVAPATSTEPPAVPPAPPSPAGTAAAPASATDASAANATTTSAPAAADAPLVLTFKGQSWVQVKDRNGNIVLAQTSQAGTTQPVSGALPFDVIIGNAAGVTATFRGRPVDLAPYVRGDVARLSLK